MENTSSQTIERNYEVTGTNLFYMTWLKTIPLILVTCVTIVTNGVIILMFVTTKSIRRCRNIYIASLAMADFLIGCTMPISILEYVQKIWSPTEVNCKFFLTLRYSLLYISLLSILLISVDRWWSINYPFSYRVRQSRTIAISAVTVSWILSFCLHIPPIAIMTEVESDLYHRNSSGSGYYGCEAPYKKHFIYLLISSIVEYLCPLIVLWILNCSIYFRISQRKSIKIRRSMSVTDTLYIGNRKSSSESEGNQNGSDESSDLGPLASLGRSVVPNYTRRHSVANFSASKQLMQYQKHRHRRVSFDVSMSDSRFDVKCASFNSRKGSFGSISSRFGIRKQSDELVRDLMVKQDKKAACSLGMMVVVFTVCWTPHMVAEVINANCGQCLSDVIMTVTLWVLLINSAINPFLYSLLNKEFLKVLKQWLSCHTSSRNYRLKEAVMYWNIMPMNAEVARDSNYKCINAVKEWSL